MRSEKRFSRAAFGIRSAIGLRDSASSCLSPFLFLADFGHRSRVSGREPQHLFLACAVARQFADGPALGHHDDAVGERQHLRQVGRHDEQGDAACRRGRAAAGRSRSALRRRRRASARRRSAAAAPCASHLASSTFCWLPPDRLPTIWCTLGVAMRSSSTKLLASASALRSEKLAPGRNLGKNRGGDVVDDVHAEEQAGRLAVLGHHADAGMLAVPRALRIDRPCRRCGSCRRAGGARRRSPRRIRCGPSRSGRRGRRSRRPGRVIEAERTSGRRAMSSASSTTVADACGPGAARERCTSRPTISRISSSVEVSATVARSGKPAVLEHGDGVAEREDLGQAVRNVDDRHAVRRQPPDDFEQLLGLGQGQRRGRLVEDQDPAGRATAPWRSRRSGPAPATARRPCSAGSMSTPSCAISASAPSRIRRTSTWPSHLRRLPAGKDVLRDRQLRHQRAFLVHDADAELAGRLLVDVAELGAVEQHLPWSRHRRRRRSCRASTCRRRSRRASARISPASTLIETSSSARTPGKNLERPRDLEPRRHAAPHAGGLGLAGSAPRRPGSSTPWSR